MRFRLAFLFGVLTGAWLVWQRLQVIQAELNALKQQETNGSELVNRLLAQSQHDKEAYVRNLSKDERLDYELRQAIIQAEIADLTGEYDDYNPGDDDSEQDASLN